METETVCYAFVLQFWCNPFLKISETFVDYILSFNFYDTNLGCMFLKKKFVLNI